MRILHVVDSLALQMGGTARAPLDLCAGLIERGHHVRLVATAAPQENYEHLAQDHPTVPTELFPRRFPHHNFRSPDLRRWLDANVEAYDLVEIHGVFSFVPLYAARACVRAGTPYTVRPHGSLDPFDLQNHALAKRVLGPSVFGRCLLGNARAVFLTSRTEADRVVTFGVQAPKSVASLPVPPPQDLGDGPAFRSDHGIPPDAVVILVLGRIHPKKGLQFLLPSLAALKESHPELWLLIVGAGEEKHMDSVDHLLRKHRMTTWTTRCPLLSGHPKQSAFAASDIFALPSLNENFGIVVVEAMYAGLPLVISSEVYIHDVVENGGVGIVCQPNISSCRSALAELLCDEALRRRMSALAPAVAHRHFQPERTTETLERILEGLLSQDDAAVAL